MGPSVGNFRRLRTARVGTALVLWMGVGVGAGCSLAVNTDRLTGGGGGATDGSPEGSVTEAGADGVGDACDCPAPLTCAASGDCALATNGDCNTPVLLPSGRVVDFTICPDGGPTFTYACSANKTLPTAYFRTGADAGHDSGMWKLDLHAPGSTIALATTLDCITSSACGTGSDTAGGQLSPGHTLVVGTTRTACTQMTIRVDPL